MSSTEETESVATLLARKEYDRAVPLLKRDLEKYPSNVRIRLQYADALAGAGRVEEALKEYDQTARFYEDNGLTVQAIAVRKKSEKVRDQQAVSAERAPTFTRPIPPSPLFEVLTADEREALVREMQLEELSEGDVVITEGEPGDSLYVVARGSVKVYTRGPKGAAVYLAHLGEGDFFGEVSILTGKPRTATITAAEKCELLRLDRESLDRLVERHPRIREILDEFCRRRASHTVDAMVEILRKRE